MIQDVLRDMHQDRLGQTAIALLRADGRAPGGPDRTIAGQLPSDRSEMTAPPPLPGPWSRRCAICLHGQADHDCVQCAEPICRDCGDLECQEQHGKPHVLTPRQIWSRSDASSAANAQEANSAYE